MAHKTVHACIIGAGLMGHGIAQAFAQAGHRVSLHDPDANTLELAPSRIAHNLMQMGVQPESVLANITLCAELEQAVASADIVTEAIPERLELKQQLFQALAHLAPPEAILASNTSVIPITSIGEKLDRQARARLVGTHWWNPAHLIPLVEIIRTDFTDEAIFEATFDLVQALGKTPVKVMRDVPGFIGNRLQHAMWREALHLVSQQVCSAETIDTVVKQSFGMRLPFLGPLENADLVGLTLTQQVHGVIFPHLCNDQVPNPWVTSLMEQGHLGMKNGRGLRNWSEEQVQGVHRMLALKLIESIKSHAV